MINTEHKVKIAKKIGVNFCDLQCNNCKFWGYNNSKPMNSLGESFCPKRKKKTFALSYCIRFEKRV